MGTTTKLALGCNTYRNYVTKFIKIKAVGTATKLSEKQLLQT